MGVGQQKTPRPSVDSRGVARSAEGSAGAQAKYDEVQQVHGGHGRRRGRPVSTDSRRRVPGSGPAGVTRPGDQAVGAPLPMSQGTVKGVRDVWRRQSRGAGSAERRWPTAVRVAVFCAPVAGILRCGPGGAPRCCPPLRGSPRRRLLGPARGGLHSRARRRRPDRPAGPLPLATLLDLSMLFPDRRPRRAAGGPGGDQAAPDRGAARPGPRGRRRPRRGGARDPHPGRSAERARPAHPRPRRAGADVHRPARRRS